MTLYTDDLYMRAAARVHLTPALDEHDATILYDWPEGDEHLEWVLTAPVKEIVSWAEMVERFDARCSGVEKTY